MCETFVGSKVTLFHDEMFSHWTKKANSVKTGAKTENLPKFSGQFSLLVNKIYLKFSRHVEELISYSDASMSEKAARVSPGLTCNLPGDHSGRQVRGQRTFLEFEMISVRRLLSVKAAFLSVKFDSFPFVQCTVVLFAKFVFLYLM